MTFFENRVIKELIGKASLLKNLPLPLFSKEGFISSLWQREVRRDFVIDVFILMTLLVIQFVKKKSGGVR
ncbi:MAG: hypothetical protein A2Y81_05355 [Nitrospirae bacterium RBG_13_43_8]|nr:MAG: hypothetical protein A2Y81_05355 [Nitrospirae bacterium RBG_13_43_8]